jgi:crotonobetainyl-CoA:carnitine CoA-transferase CaiB-like acyl-CoA transferase
MPPPLLGEQTVSILTQLGYDQLAIDEFKQRGIIKVGQD